MMESLVGGHLIEAQVNLTFAREKSFGGYDSYGYEYCRGTPCTSAKEAKTRAKLAVSTANFDGDPNPKATFWAFKNGRLTQLKISKTNTIIWMK